MRRRHMQGRRARRAKLARDRIEAYHRRQKPADEHFTDSLGVELGIALDRDRGCGLVRARGHRGLSLLGVDERCAGQGRWLPARRHGGAGHGDKGKLSPLVLAAAKLAGVDEVYRIGGAQAVAALAYGTRSNRSRGQNRRARQRLRGGGQASRLRPGRHRHDRRAVRGAHSRRQDRQCRLDRRRSAGAGRA